MRRRHAPVIDWPAGLETCDPAEWLEPGEDLTDEFTRRYSCWVRWCDARMRHLRSLGMRPDDAMHDSVGEFPQ